MAGPYISACVEHEYSCHVQVDQDVVNQERNDETWQINDARATFNGSPIDWFGEPRYFIFSVTSPSGCMKTPYPRQQKSNDRFRVSDSLEVMSSMAGDPSLRVPSTWGSS